MENLALQVKKSLNLISEDSASYEARWEFIVDENHPYQELKQEFMSHVTLCVAGDYQTPKMKEPKLYIFIFFDDDKDMKFPVKIMADYSCGLHHGDILDIKSFFMAYKKLIDGDSIIRRGFANKTGESMEFNWTPQPVDRVSKIKEQLAAMNK